MVSQQKLRHLQVPSYGGEVQGDGQRVTHQEYVITVAAAGGVDVRVVAKQLLHGKGVFKEGGIMERSQAARAADINIPAAETRAERRGLWATRVDRGLSALIYKLRMLVTTVSMFKRLVRQPSSPSGIRLTCYG